jgi:hypothetical protein
VEEYREAARGMMAHAQQQLADQVKNMPPAQRAQMDASRSLVVLVSARQRTRDHRATGGA